MTLQDTLANALSHIVHMEKTGKKQCTIRPVSTLMKKIFVILQEHNYVGSYDEQTRANGSIITLNLLAAINDCGVIKPRHAVKATDFVKFEKRYLPARNFGVLIVSTSKGIMTHQQAKQQALGGRLLAYCY